MICTNCQSDNRQEARFCKRCGVWLSPNCPFCNAALPEAPVFCDHCGRQISGQSLAVTHQPLISSPSEIAQPPQAISETLPVQPGSEPAPVSSTGTTGSQSNGSQLQQYISEEMRGKL